MAIRLELSTLAWSLDSQHLAFANSSNLVLIWNVNTGQNVYNYSGHSLDVMGVVWSPDGSRTTSANLDGTV